MSSPLRQQVLRKIPSVDEILTRPEIVELLKVHPRNVVVEAIRKGLGQLREELLHKEELSQLGDDFFSFERLSPLFQKEIDHQIQPRLRHVINALPLVDAMTRAGFTAVFLGIEPPSPEALRETRKLQNLKRDVVEQVHDLLERGLDVWGGFILGFDNDGPDIFERMIQFVRRAAIPYAMVGVLGALPNTPLYRRLEKEGRLREKILGDQFGLTNVVTKLPVGRMLAGYRHVLETLYHPEEFFERCKANLTRWRRCRAAGAGTSSEASIAAARHHGSQRARLLGSSNVKVLLANGDGAQGLTETVLRRNQSQ